MHDYVLLPAKKKEAKNDLCYVLVCLLEHIQHQATCLEKSTSINNHDSFPSNCIYSERLEVTLLNCKKTT